MATFQSGGAKEPNARLVKPGHDESENGLHDQAEDLPGHEPSREHMRDAIRTIVFRGPR